MSASGAYAAGGAAGQDGRRVPDLPDLGPEALLGALAPEDRVLLDALEQLYGGAWDELAGDLSDRLDQKPFIFKLSEKIQEDLVRIGRLRRYEAARGVDLLEVRRRLEAAKDGDGRAGGPKGETGGAGENTGAGGGSEV